mmetsp:Transcript_8397/g.12939  ORF Transcript_8397/g.12939 Transcript_8397/m.12939 type:complete len:452 (-) Transcript_8397:1392-2747(-)|eukprot:CAMPEP_0178921538 /NCGR_PEP_ID=MMETSP0786-20121207/15621_1 /TAXON_ID=186022 /ORGANISM="Thalassionema frauenfeldii, Strain CCMP 1798" /LENGTH=451 /DNA_ID=CAMNT_0020595737 /DNA_START=125 /DNA_END=1480 /DNA_ORIENTATION=+
MFDDDSLTGNSNADSITTADIEKPILVGYAFGPKKMSTMATVMAEASRARIVGVVSDETPEDKKSKMNTLTRETLHLHQKEVKAKDRGLNNVIRYFRSSCSSVGTDDESCSLTSTAGSSKASGAIPVRVSFVPVDLNEPLEEQHGGYFDILLHKMTEDILCLSKANNSLRNLVNTEQDVSTCIADCEKNLQQAVQRIHRLKQYQKSHPRCCLADDPSKVEVVMSRRAISIRLQNSLNSVRSTSGLPVETPKFISFENTIENHTLRYPLIAKPLTAAGTKKSHCMGIVSNPEGLSSVQTPCILQEYTNHDSTLYKVYVLGDDIHVFSRPSLPNLPTSSSELKLLTPFVEFDSHKPYPGLSDFGLEMPPPPKRAKWQQLTSSEVVPIVSILKRAFGLELFGFDILAGGQRLYVVDVNYFPSFKEVSNFPSLLAKYLVQLAVQKRTLSQKNESE